MNLNCLSHWFPLLEKANLPVPRTEIVRTDCELIKLMDGEEPNGFADFIAILERACDSIGGAEWFLRTGQGSGKHQWKNTCHLTDLTRLRRHVFNLVEWSECVDFLGLPHNVWVVREMLPVKPVGVCELYGDMPAVKEFRFFVKNGDVQCWHPYWPLQALNDGGFTADVSEGWYEEFCQLPEGLCDLAASVSRAVPGAWSVDLLETQRGWYVTDMAEAGRSFHWPGCSAAGTQPVPA